MHLAASRVPDDGEAVVGGVAQDAPKRLQGHPLRQGSHRRRHHQPHLQPQQPPCRQQPAGRRCAACPTSRQPHHACGGRASASRLHTRRRGGWGFSGPAAERADWPQHSSTSSGAHWQQVQAGGAAGRSGQEGHTGRLQQAVVQRVRGRVSHPLGDQDACQQRQQHAHVVADLRRPRCVSEQPCLQQACRRVTTAGAAAAAAPAVVQHSGGAARHAAEGGSCAAWAALTAAQPWGRPPS